MNPFSVPVWRAPAIDRVTGNGNVNAHIKAISVALCPALYFHVMVCLLSVLLKLPNISYTVVANDIRLPYAVIHSSKSKKKLLALSINIDVIASMKDWYK